MPEKAKKKQTESTTPATEPKLLSGGNPQIAKADGDAPVQAFIQAMPGWKQATGKQLDALIVRLVPQVQKAVRWNTPFYGIAGQGWFLGFHCFNKYIKVTFLNGALLQPMPPIASKHPLTRYYHLMEGEVLNEEQWANWLHQAANQPGEKLF